jgi:hypothetical protein
MLPGADERKDFSLERARFNIIASVAFPPQSSAKQSFFCGFHFDPSHFQRRDYKIPHLYLYLEAVPNEQKFGACVASDTSGSAACREARSNHRSRPRNHGPGRLCHDKFRHRQTSHRKHFTQGATSGISHGRARNEQALDGFRPRP